MTAPSRHLRSIPPEARPDALATFQTIARLTKRPRYHLVGETPGSTHGKEDSAPAAQPPPDPPEANKERNRP